MSLKCFAFMCVVAVLAGLVAGSSSMPIEMCIPFGIGCGVIASIVAAWADL